MRSATHEIIEASPKEADQAVGVVERASQELGKQIRALRLGLEAHVGKLPGDRRIANWMVRHAAWQPHRFTVHHNGKTSYEMLKGKPYR